MITLSSNCHNMLWKPVMLTMMMREDDNSNDDDDDDDDNDEAIDAVN